MNVPLPFIIVYKDDFATIVDHAIFSFFSLLVADVGPPIPAPPPSGNAWDKPLTGALRTGSPSTQRSVTSGSNITNSVIGQEKTSVYEFNS